VFVKAHYADDAILMPPNAPIAQGQNAIIATFKSWPTLTKFQTNDLEIEGSGNLAFIRGTYDIAMKKNGIEIEDNGKYIEIWRKNDRDEWKCIRDIFNSNMPVAQ
jgi:ketosteroid isomerase-like protein